MKNLGLLVTVKAKNGKQQEVSDFLASAVTMDNQEEKTVTWYAFQIDDTTFGIFDTFQDEIGRESHLNGEIAKELMANATLLFSDTPNIQKIKVLASK
jgi:quinol monooxygenase YgiN